MLPPDADFPVRRELVEASEMVVAEGFCVVPAATPRVEVMLCCPGFDEDAGCGNGDAICCLPETAVAPAAATGDDENGLEEIWASDGTFEGALCSC